MTDSRNGRIAKNTLILYGRTLFTLGVSLYTLRVVLNVLGAEDFGLYNVVGGIVGLLVFLPNSMASATQRYFSFALGQGDRAGLKRIFTVNWSVYVILAVVALLALETLGAWFVADVVKIPPARYDAARLLYSISVWTFIGGLLTAPFRAVITAHEDMHIFAGLTVFEVVLKLIAVLTLVDAPGDKLVAYGYLLLAVTLVVAAAYGTVCVRRYEECQFHWNHWDPTLLREVIGFTGWTLFGQLTTVFRSQAVTILMNQAFNPVVVAARAIAFNVCSQADVLAANFNTSLYPPIIKTYAAGERGEMYELVFNGAKVTFFLMWVLTLPLLLEMPWILAIWLKAPPPDAVLFTRLALLDASVTALSLPLMTAARAPGKMRGYELSLGSIQVGIFLVCWLVLKLGGAAYTVFVVSLAASLVMLFLRLVIVSGLTELPIGGFFRRVLGPVAAVAALSLSLSLGTKVLLPEGVMASCATLFVSTVFNVVVIYFAGFDLESRLKIKSAFAQKLATLTLKRIR